MMAKADDPILEPDQFPGAPHPRNQYDFIGHESGEAAFIESFQVGRLHHAWLIGGMQGIGKATLAYRVARYLLAYGATPPQTGQGLYVPPTHIVSRQIEAFSQPNLTVLRRSYSAERKTIPSIISVDAARKAMSLFETTSADGGYRVCIVDSADDLNNSSANALLKLIEEPPPLSIFLIVSHSPQRLLPTIRSRCRKLTLSPLSAGQIKQVISGIGEPFASAPSTLMDQAIAYSEGSVRKTLEMLDEKKAALIKHVQSVLHELPHVDDKRVTMLAESLAHKDAVNDFDLAMECVDHWISAKLHSESSGNISSLAQLVEVCEKLHKMVRETDVYNLDRRPLVLWLFDELSQVLRAHQ
ncbi:DNA polymerase III subunit delta' [Microvirga sp. W0021]|uniref:DNA polymerase III subunit delta n=1 Tax=Hohaiivirga grylli TaxID=3133970 RepID=A0ABV0BJH8_9HYPH